MSRAHALVLQPSGDMRTLLRKVSSGLYFQGPDHWTTNPAEGMNFKSIDRALEFVKAYNLKDVEVAFGFPDSATVTSASVEQLGVEYSDS
jgi:hypothetical protein